MKHCYDMMVENSHDVNPKNLAYLYDRIQVFQGRPQKYGTQLISGGIPFPVENKDTLNEEREKLGLPSLSRKVINQILEVEEISKIEEKDEEYMVWRKKVGWI